MALANCRLASRELVLQLAQLRQRQRPRLGLAGFPTQDGERRNMQTLGELLLRQPDAFAQLADVGLVPRRVDAAHDAPTYECAALASTTYQLIDTGRKLPHADVRVPSGIGCKRSRNACAMAPVFVSPVSCASSLASRHVSSFLMLRPFC